MSAEPPKPSFWKSSVTLRDDDSVFQIDPNISFYAEPAQGTKHAKPSNLESRLDELINMVKVVANNNIDLYNRIDKIEVNMSSGPPSGIKKLEPSTPTIINLMEEESPSTVLPPRKPS